MVNVEDIITGLVLANFGATIGTAWMLRGCLERFGERLAVIETQHKHNHKETEAK
ncbi:MAG: hypothetical protein WC749_07705 [Dehalococcoidia bacterium]